MFKNITRACVLSEGEPKAKAQRPRGFAKQTAEYFANVRHLLLKIQGKILHLTCIKRSFITLNTVICYKLRNFINNGVFAILQ